MEATIDSPAGVRQLPARRAGSVLVAATLCAVSCLVASPAHAAASDLDPGFGTGGLVTTAIGSGDDLGSGLAIQPDGRIVVVASAASGADHDFVVLRYNAQGGLDGSFDGDGKVTTSFGAGDERAAAVAIQPDGKIVVAGAAGPSIAVARYNPDGSLDPGFDGDGRVLTNMGSGTVDTARGVAIAPGGKIVVAGDTESGSGRKGAVVRYNPDGSLDAGLDGDGRLVAANPDAPTADVVVDAVAVLADGRIVLAGGTGPGCAAASGACDFEISRWKPDGNVDPLMDTDGESTTRIANYDRAHAVAVQPDGKTLAAGVSESGGTRRIAVTRYTGDNGPSPGNLDKSFGTSGVVTTTIGSNDEAWGLAVQSDGRIVVSGTSTSGGVQSFALVRYQANGSLDSSFGNGGRRTTQFPAGNADARGMAVGTDGRWVVAGSAVNSGNRDVAVARYTGQLSGPSLSGADGSARETAGAALTFTVTLASADAVPVTVRYATADLTAGPADYVPASGMLSFGPGEHTRTVTVPVLDDALPEQPETFALDLSDATPDGTLIARSRMVGTILDDETPEAQGGGPRPAGYRLVATDGGIFAFGSASFKGSTGALRLAQPIVGMTPTPSGEGYWLVASDGGIFAFGDAAFFGSTGAMRLNRPIVGMASTPTGKGYWLVASDGGVFAFGDAAFFGSTGALRLAKPIVGMAPTPSGRGYWFVASDGGVFAFGDARFLGSTGALRLSHPIVTMAATPTGNGYWLVGSDGGIFAFGDARFVGSTGALRLAKPVVGMTATRTGNGYWLVASDGGVFAFGDATFAGSTGAIRLNRPIVGMAAS